MQMIWNKALMQKKYTNKVENYGLLPDRGGGGGGGSEVFFPPFAYLPASNFNPRVAFAGW